MLRHLIGRVLLVLGVAFFIAVVSPIILTSQAALIIFVRSSDYVVNLTIHSIDRVKRRKGGPSCLSRTTGSSSMSPGPAD
jgi:hypothetical protein